MHHKLPTAPDLSGRVAIVTGAGQPAGAAVARALAAAGARVAVNDLNPDRIARLAAELRAAGGQALDVTADVANKFQCVNLIETTRAEWERVDILVNATRVRPNASVLKMDEWEWMRCADVNLKSVFFMSQLVGRVIDDQNQAGMSERGGLIVNLAWPEPEETGASAFAAAQAGVLAFSRACAREYEPLGIRVHTLLVEPDDLTAIAEAVLRLCQGPGKSALP
ncbi:SDR family NAD(P)-dependent oxidoreductase [Promineifilum sp.]|uniref:SDR family NAD(P)-dependent oxidoreductase n=1 Tax=Promineifilum sp. TaxID=2664178 RepID=UPI0035B34EB6